MSYEAGILLIAGVALLLIGLLCLLDIWARSYIDEDWKAQSPNDDWYLTGAIQPLYCTTHDAWATEDEWFCDTALKYRVVNLCQMELSYEFTE